MRTVAIANAPCQEKRRVCRPHITPLCVYESRRGSCYLGMTLKVGHNRLLFASRSYLIGAGIGLQGNPGRGISAGLQKRALQGTSLVVWKTLCCRGSHCQATPYRGEGKFEGEGGFSDSLPPLQGKFGSHSVSSLNVATSAKKKRPPEHVPSWDIPRQVSKLRGGGWQMARVLGFFIYIRGLANGPARAYLSRDSRQACPGQARRLNPSSRAVQRGTNCRAKHLRGDARTANVLGHLTAPPPDPASGFRPSRYRRLRWV